SPPDKTIEKELSAHLAIISDLRSVDSPPPLKLFSPLIGSPILLLLPIEKELSAHLAGSLSPIFNSAIPLLLLSRFLRTDYSEAVFSSRQLSAYRLLPQSIYFLWRRRILFDKKVLLIMNRSFRRYMGQSILGGFLVLVWDQRPRLIWVLLLSQLQ
ncbi:unnamed protein product, partial [Linum tenue]